MIERIRAVLVGNPNCDTCLEETVRNTFRVYDYPDEFCRIVRTEEEISSEIFRKSLLVQNSTSKQITCISWDNCMVRTGTDKCDAILFDETTFVFVEMKTNASSINNFSKNCEHAQEQIEATNKYFEDNKMSFNNYKKEGIICFTENLLTGVIKNKNASINTFRVLF